MTKKLRKKNTKFVAIVIIVLLAAATYSLQSSPLNVIFFDVGQGDAILINGPDNFQILIDGGSDDTLAKKIGKYLPANDRTIEVILLSHPDSDHLTGLIEIVRRYNVRYVIQTSFISENALTLEWRAVINEKKAAIIDATINTVIKLPDQASIDILSPRKGGVYRDANAKSIICIYNYADKKILFLGDATPEAQAAALTSRTIKDIDIVKISHHGSEKSYNDELIKAAKPAESVIQVGAGNRFGHPSPSVINQLKNNNIAIHRTDLEGDIIYPLTDMKNDKNKYPIIEIMKKLWYNINTNIKLPAL